MQYPVHMALHPEIASFFDPQTNTISHVVKDPATSACAVIDPVMDIDYASGRITYTHADDIIAYITRNKLRLEWVIETHVHADHLSAARYIQAELGGKIGIGAKITRVQDTFADIFGESEDFPRDGSQFDHLFEDGEPFTVGEMPGFAIHTPGHTPACMTFVFGDAAFVGDTLFMPDAGSARADFPGGDAGQLYTSMQTILALPDDMRLFMCHDYGPNGREIMWQTTVAEEKANNIHVGHGTSRESFFSLRTTRDATLAVPKLILPSLQVNMRAGELPKARDGRPVLKVPVNAI